LTKAIDFSDRVFEPKEVAAPIKFVYTGSLAIGRGETLALVADALNNIDSGKSSAELDIYSQTTPKVDVLSRINKGCAHFMGKVSHLEIESILKKADVVIFAEAIKGKERFIAKLSFSTKITDYLAAGKCILAIGDKEIAPIDYFIKNDSAIIATNPEEIETRLKEILENHNLINIYGKKAFECAYNNHEKNAMIERFVSTMCRATK
jgi:glycosyltransferase involved in cell wall biosynthesis